jgi:hypothetical protein
MGRNILTRSAVTNISRIHNINYDATSAPTVRTLLVQSCSKSKNRPNGAVDALDLYSGFFFRILKKARREGAFDPAIDLCILSAKHGLLDPESSIERYDREMDQTRAVELAPRVTEALAARAGSYDRVVVNAGRVYRAALHGLTDSVTTPVYYIDGGGIGEKGHILKRLVRTDAPAVTSHLVASPEAP